MQNVEIKKISQASLDIAAQKNLSEFLFKHLERFGDSQEAINACFNYFKDPKKGGNLYSAYLHEELVGVCIILKTHMDMFLPENFLVYIAVDPTKRGLGIGKKIINYAQNELEGSICLHVEPDNPARNLYEREGFTSKYLEMRYHH